MPRTATRCGGRAPLFRNALNVVMPAHQWCGLDGGQPVGDASHRLEGNHHVVGVAAVLGDAGYATVTAGDEVAPAARLAIFTVPAVPTHSHARSRLPLGDLGADGIDHPGNLVARHARIGAPRPSSLFGQRVAVTQAAGLDFDPHLARTRLRNLALNKLQRTLWAGGFDCTHLRHGVLMQA